MNRPVRFLTLAEILLIHENQIRTYGGEYGVRDIHLISSAIALPESTFDGKYLHKGEFEMAGAYAYHLCQNHPFIDGNKRTALASALVFLELNGINVTDPRGQLYDGMMAMAKSELRKDQFSALLRSLGDITPLPPLP